MPIRLSLVATFAVALAPGLVAAQPLGSFTWQMQPFCNVVTATLTRVGTTYTVDGYDDQCGASRRAGVVGIAVTNPDGTIGIDFTVVTTPGGKGVHVTAAVNPASGNGLWADSVGNSGALVFGSPAGAAQGAPARPSSASGLGPASVGRAELAPAAVGAAEIDALQVQRRVTGACASGHALQGINADGTVRCEPLPAPPSSAFTRTSFSFATVSPAGQPPDILASLTFAAPLSGKAFLRARGTCNMVPQWGVENAVNIVPTIGAPGQAFVAFDLGNWAIVRVPSGDPLNGVHQLAWTAERVVDVASGQTYTVTLAGQHEAGATTTSCHGSLTVAFHDADLP